jgi:hypothetical protein
MARASMIYLFLRIENGERMWLVKFLNKKAREGGH